MRPTKKRDPLLTTLLLILLALACVGAAELAVCRFAAPETFRRITAPVVSFAKDTASSAVSFARDTWDAASREAKALTQQGKVLAERLLAAISKPESDPPEGSQLASDPAITEELDIADPTITEFREEDGREVLTGGNVLLTYYNQKDPDWAEQPYGADQIGGYGCGPTSLAMLVSSLTDTDIDPAEMADWAARSGYCARHSGSYHSIVEGTAKAYGLSCSSLSVTDPQDLITGLSTGGIAVALMGPGHFTNSGHFILLHGATLSGGVLAADPNSRDNSLVVWDPQLILDELSASRMNGGPLWLITVPPEPADGGEAP